MSRRVEKVSELIKRQLSLMIRQKVAEEFGLVTITDVIITPDFKIADIFISCFENKYQNEVFKILSLHTKEFQHQLGKTLNMRYTPKLYFKIDKGLEKVNNIEHILNQIKNEA